MVDNNRIERAKFIISARHINKSGFMSDNFEKQINDILSNGKNARVKSIDFQEFDLKKGRMIALMIYEEDK